MNWIPLLIATMAAATFTGCSLLGEDGSVYTPGLLPSYQMRAIESDNSDGENRVRGILHFYGDDAPIEVPETATAGEPFEVKISTFGGGCDEMGGAIVEADELQATIHPYDLSVADEEIACPAILKEMRRSVQLTFQQSGEAVVRVVGLRVDGRYVNGIEEVVERIVRIN